MENVTRLAPPAELPGVLLAAAIAGTAMLLRQLPGFAVFSPLMLSMLLGMLLANSVPLPTALVGEVRPGLHFTLRRLLRLSVVLLGMQVTFGQVAEVGGTGLGIVAASLAATFLFTLWLGHRLGVEPRLTRLMAAGTSICGASAIAASNTVVEARDEDVAYAMAAVTVFGSLSMILYPLLQGMLALPAHAYGLWAGASIHEVAQAVAAAFQGGMASGEVGTISKLARVLMLAPVILLLGLGRKRTPVPWFVLGFVALAGLNSLDLLPAVVRDGVVTVNQVLLSAALAAMGLETRLAALRQRGLRPLLLGAGAWLFISLFSLSAVMLTGV